MYIYISVALSSDNCLDDMTPERLRLSTPSDWAEVYRLRAASGAILIGGETLRRDNPTLGVKSEQLMMEREARGESREPMRVVVSGDGEISPESNIFHKGSGHVVVFSHRERPELMGLAKVIVAPLIDVPLIVTELEKLGVTSLFVEGGAKIIDLFISSKMVSMLRVAVNPDVVVDDISAPRLMLPSWVEQSPQEVAHFEQMRVVTYSLSSNSQFATQQDRELMRAAVEYSRQSPPKESCYRVGAIIKTVNGEIFKGYTLETSPTHHAEQAAMKHAIDAGADLRGATIYASMEPCSQRSSEPKSCSELIMQYGISRTLFALYEPSHFVKCHGAENLRRAGVQVIWMGEFASEVFDINRHVL